MSILKMLFSRKRAFEFTPKHARWSIWMASDVCLHACGGDYKKAIKEFNLWWDEYMRYLSNYEEIEKLQEKREALLERVKSNPNAPQWVIKQLARHNEEMRYKEKETAVYMLAAQDYLVSYRRWWFDHFIEIWTEHVNGTYKPQLPPVNRR